MLQLALNEIGTSICDSHLELDCMFGHLLLAIIELTGDVIDPHLCVIQRVQIEFKILILRLSSHY